MGKTKKITMIGVLCAAVVFTLWGCSSKSGSGDNKDVPTQKSTYAVGEMAEKDGLKVTLKGVSESSGNALFKPASGNTYLLCEFELVNDSSKSVNISSALLFNAYVDNTQVSMSLSATSSDNSKGQLDGEIGAGKKMVGVIGYEVPADWNKIEVEFEPNMSSANKMTFTATK